jgi:hypothetical protein
MRDTVCLRMVSMVVIACLLTLLSAKARRHLNDTCVAGQLQRFEVRISAHTCVRGCYLHLYGREEARSKKVLWRAGPSDSGKPPTRLSQTPV